MPMDREYLLRRRQQLVPAQINVVFCCHTNHLFLLKPKPTFHSGVRQQSSEYKSLVSILAFTTPFLDH